MRSDGLRIEGPTALHVPRVSATDDPGEVGVVDVVMLCVKPALDAALGDALALGAGLPLATLLGGAPRPLPAYNSCGLGLMSPPAAADEAERLLEGGFKALKLRLGYASLAEDLAATRAVRQRLPDDVALMVDYNQALSVSEALLRGRALQSEGVAWLEEPTRHDDLRGNAEITRALELPLQIGENFNGPQALAQALDAQACDLAMPDVARIGGGASLEGIAHPCACAHRVDQGHHRRRFGVQRRGRRGRNRPTHPRRRAPRRRRSGGGAAGPPLRSIRACPRVPNVLAMNAGGCSVADFARVGGPQRPILWVGLSILLALRYGL